MLIISVIIIKLITVLVDLKESIVLSANKPWRLILLWFPINVFNHAQSIHMNKMESAIKEWTLYSLYQKILNTIIIEITLNLSMMLILNISKKSNSLFVINGVFHSGLEYIVSLVQILFLELQMIWIMMYQITEIES